MTYSMRIRGFHRFLVGLILVTGGSLWPILSHAQPNEWSTRVWKSGQTCASCHDAGNAYATPLSHASAVGLANLKTFSLFASHMAGVAGNSDAMTAFSVVANNGLALTSATDPDRDAAEAIRLYFLLLIGNSAPTATASASVASVVPGRTVSLSGSGAGVGGTYSWKLNGPATSVAVLSSTSSPGPTFVPDVVGSYTVNLIATNAGGVASAPNRVSVSATANAVPTANAGPDQAVAQGTPVMLNGSGIDPNSGTTLTYQWSLQSSPVAVSLSSPTVQNPTFTPTVVGTYRFGLTVHDEVNTSAADTVDIVVTPAVGNLQAAPSSLTGFSARAGGSTPDVRLLTLSNAGPALSSVALNSFIWPTGYSQDASQVCTPPGSCCAASTTLASGQSCQLWVRFLPSATGDYANRTLAIGYTASGSAPATQNVTFSGVATQSTIGTTLSTAVLNFGSVQNGFNRPEALTITNTGTATLNFSSDPRNPARLSGSSEYTVVGGTCAQGTPLAPTVGTCTLDLRFAPLIANAALPNPRQATLTLTSDAGNGPLVVTLTGTASPLPVPSAAPISLTFTATAWGDTSASQNVVITNPRSDDITYTLGAPSSTDFIVVDDGNATCPARKIPANGGKCTIKLAFRPQATSGATCLGLRCADLSVSFTPTSGPAISPLSVHAVGTAIASLRTSANALTLMTMATVPVIGSVVVTNQSNASVTLGSISFSGATAPYGLEGAGTCAPNGTVAAGATCILSVRYRPLVAASDEAVVTVPFGSAGSTLTVDLHGTATALPQGIVQLGASTLAFGDTPLTTTASRTLSVRNTGNKVAVFTAFEVAGANAADFRSSGGTCSTSTALGIGADCTISVDFVPGALGARAASLTVRSDGVDPALVVSLTGNATPVPAPQVVFSPLNGATGAVVFGNQTVGGIYPPRIVQLTNAGTAPLQISGFTVDGPGFSLAGSTCAVQLAPQASCDLLIGFTPSAADIHHTGTLKAATNAQGSPQSVALRGQGVAYMAPVLIWQPELTGLTFGTVSVGNLSATQSAVLSNQGPGGATLTLMNAVGTAAAEFAVGSAQQPPDNSTCIVGMVLQQGQRCRVDVRFVPAVSGDRGASLQIVSTGAAPPALRLSGTGMSSGVAALTMSASTLDLGSVRQGAHSAPADVVLSSTGSGLLTVSTITVSGPFAVHKRTCPALPFTLLAGSQCTVTVTFTPDAEGAATGKLSFTSNAAPAEHEVSLSGQGEKPADLSSGGCSISAGTGTGTDPTLWTLVLLAGAVLYYRARMRRAAARRQP